MRVEDFISKTYDIPRNIPSGTSHKYLELVNKGYAKYLEIINLCGNFAMYKQFYKLVKIYEGQNRTERSNENVANKIINHLIELGFLGSSHINKNKFVYLRKSGIAVATGDYNNNQRVSLVKDLKNDKFIISVLRLEYFLSHQVVLHYTNMINQLRFITNEILKNIVKSGNKFGYSVEVINQILTMSDFLEIKEYLDSKPEHIYKLDIIRELWEILGNEFRKMVLQRQTVAENPLYLKLFIKHDGKIGLHYIPNIIVFDVSNDLKYYRDKSIKLFHLFYGIKGNALRNVQKTFMGTSGQRMGLENECRIGYKLTLIGVDDRVLLEKKKVIDEDVDSSVNSPLMGYTDIVSLPVGEYLYHASRKGNKFSKKHNDRIEGLILKKIVQLKENEKKGKPKEANSKANFLDLVRG